MPPVDFDKLAGIAFNSIKRSLSIDAFYQPKSGGQYNVRGPFSDNYQQVDPDTEIPISSNVYAFGLKRADLPVKPLKGDKLIVREIPYQVIEVQEDGVPDASVVLILHKVLIS